MIVATFFTYFETYEENSCRILSLSNSIHTFPSAWKMGLGHYQKKNYGHPALRITNYFWTTYEICTRTWGLALREPILTKMNALRHFPTAAADRDKWIFSALTLLILAYVRSWSCELRDRENPIILVSYGCRRVLILISAIMTNQRFQNPLQFTAK